MDRDIYEKERKDDRQTITKSAECCFKNCVSKIPPYHIKTKERGNLLFSVIKKIIIYFKLVYFVSHLLRDLLFLLWHRQLHRLVRFPWRR